MEQGKPDVWQTIEQIVELRGRADRQDGKITEAIELALSYIETGAGRRAALMCWLAAFQGHDGCLLLDYARRVGEFSDKLLPVLDRIGADKFVQQTGEARPLVEARLALLNALLEARKKDIVAGVRRAVELCDAQWAYAGMPDNAIAGLEEPLPRSSGWRNQLKAIAAPPHRRTPGLLAVRDTIAHIYGKMPAATNKVATWVLLVAKSRNGGSHGVVGQLVLERIEPGWGTIYPHPCLSGYVAMDETFREGIAAAIQCALGGGRLLEFDVRFSLRADDVGDLPLPASGRFTGHSAEVAFACALRALIEGEDLDQHAAATAAFVRPLVDNLGWELDKVEGVEHKLSSELLKRKQIDEVVVASSQRELEWLSSGHIPLIAVGGFEDAWDRLSRFQRLTRLSCERIATEATKALAKSCGGISKYILPSLSRPPLRKVDDSMMQDDGLNDVADELLPTEVDYEPGDGYSPLTAKEVLAIVMQRDTLRRRTRILADSAMGKTSFLLYVSKQIAEAQEGRLPILVTHISDLPWGDNKQLIKKLSSQLVGHLTSSANRREEWLMRLIERGKVVFLLDALDQTGTIDGLASFIDSVSANSAACSVLITGRPFVLNSKGAAFRGDWQTLRLDPFDKRRQRKYLGKKHSAQLLDSRSWRPWKDLLEVPLLLQLLRDLAGTGKLTKLPNRHAIYSIALAELIAQGKLSLAETPYAEFLVDQTDVDRILCRIAWEMVVGGNFTGVANGKEYRQLRDRISDPKLLQAITQVNITTLESVLDIPSEVRFAWRHLSFCEFFAGLYLARHYPGTRDRLAEQVRQHACDAQWEWVFRFALSEAQANDSLTQRDWMAADLIRLGNPFLVLDAVSRDKVRIRRVTRK